MSFKNIEGQLARWMEELAQFDMVVVHRAGKLHVNADVLSRIPETEGYCPKYRAGVSLSDLPCYSRLNPCKFCTRTEARWARFEDEMDYVVPLSVSRIQVDVPSGGADYWLSGYSKGDLSLKKIQLSLSWVCKVLRWDIIGNCIISCSLSMGFCSTSGWIFWILDIYWWCLLLCRRRCCS